MKKKDFWSKPSKDDWAGMAGYSDKKMRNIYLNDNMTAYLNLYKKYLRQKKCILQDIM